MKLAHSAPTNYTFYNSPTHCSNLLTLSAVVMAFSFVNLPYSYHLHLFQMFFSSITLKLSHSKLSVFNICLSPASSPFCKTNLSFLAYSWFCFLSVAVTTAYEFLITGDFNIHVDNHSDCHYLSVSLSTLFLLLNSTW